MKKCLNDCLNKQIARYRGVIVIDWHYKGNEVDQNGEFISEGPTVFVAIFLRRQLQKVAIR